MLRCRILDTEFETWCFTDPDEALARINEREVEVVLAEEELTQMSGLDWLVEVREQDPMTSLILMANERHTVDLAVDAINKVRICKLLTHPLKDEDITRELHEAAALYGSDIRKDRQLRLAKIKVRRLSRSVNETRRALAHKDRELRALQYYPPQEPPQTRTSARYDDEASLNALLGPANGNHDVDEKDLEIGRRVSKLLQDVVRSAEPEGEAMRIRTMAEGCARALGWDSEETEELRVAATLHHATITFHSGERLQDTRGGSCTHAISLGERLSAIPGLAKIATIVQWHHIPPGSEEQVPSFVPRSARLLQIVSYFDEALADPEILAIQSASDYSDLALVRASEAILQNFRNSFEPELAEVFVKTLIPRLMKRDEVCIPVEDAEEGMELTRTVYANNLALVRSGVELTALTLDKIRAATAAAGFSYLWYKPRPEAESPSENIEKATDQH
jgi:ActR/RegA family two-component response regulator